MASSIVYVVKSENGVETRRTDKKVAEEDAGIVRDILRRWCEVTEEVRDDPSSLRGVS